MNHASCVQHPANQGKSKGGHRVARYSRHAAMLVVCVLLLAMSTLAHAKSGWDFDAPGYHKPHPVFWRVSVVHVDVLVNGRALRWQGGNCSDAKATANCITRIYMLPPKTDQVKVACHYRYDMQPGYKANASAGYDTIPQHAPYMQHWPIILKDDTAGRDIASLWSAQPAGHVYAHLRIAYDSQGNVTARYIDYRNPAQRTCDQHFFSNCFWDVDPRKTQAVTASWHPTPGDHVLRCTLYPLSTPGWFPSPVPISRVKVHMPYPPRQAAKTDTLNPVHPVAHGIPGKQADAGMLTSRVADNRIHMTAHRAVPAALPKPRLAIRSASASLTHVCDPRQLVRVRFTVVNEGGPLVRTASDLAYVQVRDAGAGSLNSANAGLPNLARGQSWTHTLVLGTHMPLGKFPGVHRLTLYTGPDNAMPGKLPYVPAAAFHVRLDVPAGYCRVMHRNLSPARMRDGH